MRAETLHRDVIVVTSQVFQAHCTLVRGPQAEDGPVGEPAGESFAIDSLVLPEELELLPAIAEQAGFPQPQGLLATHMDWDHVLGPLAFPEATLGCAQSSAERLRAEPGAQQRELRRFDEELLIERRLPLSLGSPQALAVPGRCSIGAADLELHPATGHTADGMAVWAPWAGVLVAGDYLSPVELPELGEHDGALEQYLATLERLRPLVRLAEHVVPGHGIVLDGRHAARVLQEDVAYLNALRDSPVAAKLPPGRSGRYQRAIHSQNVATL